MIRPSAATLSPAVISTTSPRTTSSIGIDDSTPPRRTACGLLRQRLQRVHRALGLALLPEADDGVDDRQQEQQGPRAPLADGERHDGGDEQDDLHVGGVLLEEAPPARNALLGGERVGSVAFEQLGRRRRRRGRSRGRRRVARRHRPPTRAYHCSATSADASPAGSVTAMVCSFGQNGCRDVPHVDARLVAVGVDLALGERDLLPLQPLVGHLAEQVRDHVEPGALLVVGMRDEPRRPCGVGRGEHLVTRAAVLVPLGVRQQIEVGQLPDLARIVDPALQPPGLLVGAHLEPVLHQHDAGVDHRLLDRGDLLQEPLRQVVGAEAHDPFDAGPVVPTAVEDDDLSRGGEVRDVSLHVHLRLLALGRRGQAPRPGTRGG